MTTSNVYIGWGERGGTAVMKVGKCKNVRQRQKELGITIEIFVPQPDNTTALNFETQLRLFVLDQGGKRLPRTTDWFYFDPYIYAALCAAVAEFNEKATGDAEIRILLTRYHQRLEEEKRTAISDNPQQLKDEIERLKAINAAQQKRIEKLSAEIHRLRDDLAVERWVKEGYLKRATFWQNLYDLKEEELKKERSHKKPNAGD